VLSSGSGAFLRNEIGLGYAGWARGQRQRARMRAVAAELLLVAF